MTGFTEFLKKDISFKRKPEAKAETKATKPETKAPKAETPKAETSAPEAETTATTQEKTQEKASPKRSLSLPKRAPKQKKVSSNGSGGGRHKQLVGLSVGASQLTASVVVNNGSPKLVKAARHAIPP